MADEGKLHITWDKPDDLEAYIRQLQQAAEKLTTKNRLLRKQHMDICNKVAFMIAFVFILFAEDQQVLVKT